MRGAPDFSYAQATSPTPTASASSGPLDHPDRVMTIVRPAIVFGPNVDNYIVRSFENNPFMPILDGVEEEFQLVHEDDVVSALIAPARREGAGAFNLAGDGTMTWRASAELVGQEDARDLAQEHEPPQRDDVEAARAPDRGPGRQPRLPPLPVGRLDREAQVDDGLAADATTPSRPSSSRCAPRAAPASEPSAVQRRPRPVA